jgi:hypothetical protein
VQLVKSRMQNENDSTLTANRGAKGSYPHHPSHITFDTAGESYRVGDRKPTYFRLLRARCASESPKDLQRRIDLSASALLPTSVPIRDRGINNSSGSKQDRKALLVSRVITSAIERNDAKGIKNSGGHTIIISHSEQSIPSLRPPWDIDAITILVR